MNDFLEEFDAMRTGEIAVGVFVALAADKLIKYIILAACS